jgi:hypothetical protein
MSQPDITASRRLFGMMQHLMVIAAQQGQPDAPAPRNVVTREDARDAILQVAAVIDEAVQDGRISPGRGVHGAAMLMLIRDFVQPLPAAPDDNGADRVTPDLVEMLKELRQAGGETGIQG